MPDPRNHLENCVTCSDASVFTAPRHLERGSRSGGFL